MANNVSQSQLGTLQSAVPAKYGVAPANVERSIVLATGAQTVYPAAGKTFVYIAAGAAAAFTFTAAACSQLKMNTGDLLRFQIINDSANTITPTAGTGVTLGSACTAHLTVTTRQYSLLCTSSVGTAANPNGLYLLYN